MQLRCNSVHGDAILGRMIERALTLMIEPLRRRLRPPHLWPCIPSGRRSFAAACRGGGVRTRIAGTGLLILALMVVQTGMLMHVIGHTHDVPHARTGHGQLTELGGSTGTDGDCLECVALCGLDCPLTVTATVKPAAQPDSACIASCAGNIVVGGTLRPRCRAPPFRV